jgi:hypothetical protein
MSKWSPVDELNREKERELLMPLILGLFVVLLLAPFAIALILYYKEEIDAFSMKHPVILALCFIVPGVWGWIVYGRRNNLW